MQIDLDKHFENLKGYEFHAMTTVSKTMGTLVKCKPYGLIEFSERVESFMTKGDRILVVKKDPLKEIFSFKLGLIENVPKEPTVLEEQKLRLDALIEETDEEFAIICNDNFIKVLDVSF